MNSVYVHIPFCSNICSYCDFCKMFYEKEFSRGYFPALEAEIKSRYTGEALDTLYVGGGTPSCLSKCDLTNLFKILNKFELNDDCEFTFECNINDINEELLCMLSDNRVNRLSIGIQSFNKKKLKLLERKHTFKMAKKAIKLCRKHGFDNINVDLIYGVGKEKKSTLKEDLNLFLKLNVEHISTYSLIIEENTKLYINKTKNVNEELDAAMYELIIDKLTDNKFEHYEISNFAKKGYESRHNQVYWNNNEYYGFGLGATGYMNGVRYTNTRNLKDYINGKFVVEELFLSKTEMMDNELMLGLRLIKGINVQRFYNKYDLNIQDVYKINDLLKERVLRYKDGYLYIASDKLYVMNEILLRLL